MLFLLPACAAFALLAAGRTQAAAEKNPPKATPDERKNTFGTKPCGRLVSIEEVETVFKASVPMIDIVEEGTCNYEGASGPPFLTVRLASDARLGCTAQDGTYLGKLVEPVTGVGDRAVWSKAAGTLCFVKGEMRVQLTFGSTLPEGVDPKGAAVDLARKAAGRLPRTGRP